MKAFFKHFRVGVALNAAVCLLLGVLLLVFPRGGAVDTYRVLAVVVAVAVIAFALLLIIRALAKKRGTEGFGSAISLGIVTIALGIGMLLDLSVVEQVVVWLLTLFVLYHAILDLFFAVRQQKLGVKVWYLTLIFGILLIAAAAMCLPRPEAVTWGGVIDTLLAVALIVDAVVGLWNAVVLAVYGARAEKAAESAEEGPVEELPPAEGTEEEE